jgi:glycosyltransferase involved in cell wall biosynthesis
MKTINSPNISVIIPVFNREGSMKKAITSVLNQTYNQWELIIVDDNSQDSSFEKAIQLSKEDERISVYQLSKNSGAAAARNFGISKSRANLISLLDSDDWYEPNFLKKTFLFYAKQPLDVGFIWTGVRYFKANNIIKDFVWQPKIESSAYLTFLKDLHIGTNSGLTFRKEVFKECGNFREDLPAAEDTEFLLRITQKYNFNYIDSILININQESSDRLSKNFEKLAIAYKKFLPGHFSIINKSSQLQLKYYYKMMWLNYYIKDRKSSRKYFLKLLKNINVDLKSIVIFFLFELFPLDFAKRIHQIKS